MSDYPDCYESQNVICKHVRATILVYVDLNNRLQSGVTIVDATVDVPATETLITLGTPEIVDTDLVVEEDSSCGGLTLRANRAIVFEISGGSPSDDEVLATVGWTDSDGQIDYVDCRFIIGGRIIETPLP